MASILEDAVWMLSKRDTSDADGEEAEAGEKEIFASWALFILIILLIIALFMSYFLQTRRIQAVHETVISIFAGMFVGLVLRLTPTGSVLGFVSFDYQFFFNLLLPPIILASGYELHQGNFFRNIGTILTFAFAGTFISALVIGIILWICAYFLLQPKTLLFVEAMSVGASLSATDPVTILAIFSTYRVDPKLYTIIFGESILNDAVAIVLFETAKKYTPKVDLDGLDEEVASLTIFSLFESFGSFMMVFFGSLIIGLLVGIATSLFLKMTYIRRFPKLESCIIILIAYASYFFSTAIKMSGIVSLLFCGICLKHYAYHNMSRRTQLTTKFIFQVLAQLSENFIFIYLGLSLFTEVHLTYNPLLILVTVAAVCAARWCAVFPLAKAINWFIRYRNNREGTNSGEEIPWPHQAMLFWAGLRGAVGVALAAGLKGQNAMVLRATILVVVVLTVIIFGGTTARMLEILGIQTGVQEEVDSDDEFDIEFVQNSSTSRKSPSMFDSQTKLGKDDNQPAHGTSTGDRHSRPNGFGYSSGNLRRSPPSRSDSSVSARKNSMRSFNEGDVGLVSPVGSIDEDGADLDLPPLVRRPNPRDILDEQKDTGTGAGTPARDGGTPDHVASRGEAIRQFLQGSREDPANWFRHLDEDFIKPKLLLEPRDGHNHGSGNV